MNEAEARLRALYLYSNCDRILDEALERIRPLTVGQTMESRPASRTLKRELGMLLRHWCSRKLWEMLEAQETLATQFNLEFLRLCIRGFKLSRDGSGLRYAELSSLQEELRECAGRLQQALGGDKETFARILEENGSGWNAGVCTAVDRSLTLSRETIDNQVRSWMQERQDDPNAPYAF